MIHKVNGTLLNLETSILLFRCVYKIISHVYTKMDWADSSKPRKLIKKALENPAFLQSFYSLKNVKEGSVYGTFDAWAKRRKMSKYTRDALKGQLDIRRADEFKAAISKCITWLTHRRLKKYSMIVEISPATAKSSTWLAGPVIAGLKSHKIHAPYSIIPFTSGRLLSPSAVKEALDAGITTFVHVDDAIYSGSQKGILVRQLTTILRTRQIKHARLLIGVAYTTDLGRRYISRLTKAPLKLEFFAAHTIRTRKLPWVSRVELMLRGDKNISVGGPAMTVLPHKMPNSVSFGPASLSKNLQSHIQKPVYKKFYLPST